MALVTRELVSLWNKDCMHTIKSHLSRYIKILLARGGWQREDKTQIKDNRLPEKGFLKRASCALR